MTPNLWTGRQVAVLLAAASAAACGGGSEQQTAGVAGNPTGSAPNVIARYQLDRVNSKSLPVGDGPHLFINGALELHDDDSWCIELDWRGDLSFSHVWGDRGTFELHGNSIAFSSPAGDNPAFTGSVDSTGKVTVDYQMGSSADRFTFVQPADDLTPHCGQ